MMDPNPNPYAATAPKEFGAQPAQRPVSPKVLGIFNIVFGVIGLIATAVSFVMMDAVSQMPQNGPPNPALEAMKNPEYGNWIMATMPIGIVATLLLIASGVGLCMYRKWGRTAAIWYVGFSVLAIVVGMYINYRFLLAPMLAEAQDGAAGPEVIGGAVGGVIGGVMGSCGGLVYPVIVAVFMCQKRFRDSLS